MDIIGIKYDGANQIGNNLGQPSRLIKRKNLMLPERKLLALSLLVHKLVIILQYCLKRGDLFPVLIVRKLNYSLFIHCLFAVADKISTRSSDE